MTIELQSGHCPGDIDELLEHDFEDLLGTGDITWVEAAPFRAHVRRLMRECDLPWRTVAMLAEIPAATMEHLMVGHGGRRLQRLHPLIARRLFNLTLDAVRDAAVIPIRAEPTADLLRRLLHQGWLLPELSRRTGVPDRDLAALAAGRSSSCTQLTAATLRAATQALRDPPVPPPSAGNRGATAPASELAVAA